MFAGNPPRSQRKMRHIKTDIPYAWFWLGKPLRKGYPKGERITPVQLPTPQSTPDSSRRSSREPSPVHKLHRPGCGCALHEQTRPLTPPSGTPDHHPIRPHGFGPCYHVEQEQEQEQELPEPAQKCPCDICTKPSPATAPIHHVHSAPTCSSRTMTPVTHSHHQCAASSSRTVYCLSCLEYHHEYQYLAAVPITSPQQPVEQPAPSPAPPRPAASRSKSAPRKCTCTHCAVAAVAPEIETHHQGCYTSNDCRADNYHPPMVEDDTSSMSSMEMASGSDCGVKDCCCGRLIFAIPVDGAAE